MGIITERLQDVVVERILLVRLRNRRRSQWIFLTWETEPCTLGDHSAALASAIAEPTARRLTSEFLLFRSGFDDVSASWGQVR
jgi:hypothetical protein